MADQNQNQNQKNQKILRRRQLTAQTGLAISTVYDKLSITSPRFDPTFPRPIKIGKNAVGWLEADVDRWISSRILASELKYQEKIATKVAKKTVQPKHKTHTS